MQHYNVLMFQRFWTMRLILGIDKFEMSSGVTNNELIKANAHRIINCHIYKLKGTRWQLFNLQ